MNKREREEEHSSRRRVSQRHQRNKKFLNKGIAYFLIFLMLLGNLQALTYAEGNAKEIAEKIGVKAEESTEKSNEEKKSADLSEDVSEKDESKDKKSNVSIEKEDSSKEGKTKI